MKTIIFLLILNFQVAGFSETTTPETEKTDSDKLNVDNLEKKYWSSKDDSFTVVQNRTFSKVKRYFLSAQTGKLINDGFSESTPNIVSLGYFWNERWGIELNQQTFSTKDNAVTNGFKQNFGVYPNFNRTKSTSGIGVVFVPIYAKVSLFEQKILYLDLSFGLNAGTTKYVIETDKGAVSKETSHFGLDITQHWFVSKNFALRFDIRNKWSSQERLKYQIQSSAPEESRVLGRGQMLDTTWQFGITYFH